MLVKVVRIFFFTYECAKGSTGIQQLRHACQKVTHTEQVLAVTVYANNLLVAGATVSKPQLERLHPHKALQWPEQLLGPRASPLTQWKQHASWPCSRWPRYPSTKYTLAVKKRNWKHQRLPFAGFIEYKPWNFRWTPTTGTLQSHDGRRTKGLTNNSDRRFQMLWI